jgi:hypothetical protein
MRRDVFVYISGPMTAKHGHTVEENVAAGVRVYLDCLKRGIPAFSPHLGGAFPSAWTDVSWETWLEYDLAVIDRCTHVLMMPRWQESAGAIKEHDYAQSIGCPIAYSMSELVISIQGCEPAIADDAVARPVGVSA